MYLERTITRKRVLAMHMHALDYSSVDKACANTEHLLPHPRVDLSTLLDSLLEFLLDSVQAVLMQRIFLHVHLFSLPVYTVLQHLPVSCARPFKHRNRNDMESGSFPDRTSEARCRAKRARALYDVPSYPLTHHPLAHPHPP
jgi:hypothetical protein